MQLRGEYLHVRLDQNCITCTKLLHSSAKGQEFDHHYGMQCVFRVSANRRSRRNAMDVDNRHHRKLPQAEIVK